MPPSPTLRTISYFPMRVPGSPRKCLRRSKFIIRMYGNLSLQASESASCVITRHSLMVIKAMKLRYRFRFYPTPVQREMLSRVFGSCRYVYNWALRLRSDAWSKEGRSVTYCETSALLTRLKREPDHAWLGEVSC